MRTLDDLEEVQSRDVPESAWFKAIAVQLAILNETMAGLLFVMTPWVDEEESEIVVELEPEVPEAEEHETITAPTPEPKPAKTKSTKA